MARISFYLLLLLALSSCATSGDKLALKKSDFSTIDGWENDNHQAALQSFLKSCDKFSGLPQDKMLHKTGIGGTYGDWKGVCEKARDVKSQWAAKRFFETSFIPYKVSNGGNDKGKFTGYFEIGLEGSRTKHGAYQYPIYRKPSDLKDGEKYYTRRQIDAGKLAGKGLEILWVNDPVQLFFLHVQGSGRIKMDDGSVVQVGYNGRNGYPYSSVGRYMLDKGYLKANEGSAQSMKKWLRTHPDKAGEVMAVNESYIFFREQSGDGPIGGQGVALTPMRSLAVDKEYIPYGAPVWLDVNLSGSGKKLQSLMVSQDTGSAIVGPVRGDIFFGYGQDAEEMAGYQNNKGSYFVLLPIKERKFIPAGLGGSY